MTHPQDTLRPFVFELKPGERIGVWGDDPSHPHPVDPGWLLYDLSAQVRGVQYWNAEHPQWGKATLKIVWPEAFSHDPTMWQFNAEVEVQRLQKITHPVVQRILTWGTSEKHRCWFTALEKVKGYPLSHFIEENSLSPTNARALFMTLAEGLGACHAQGVLHRKIQPEYIYLTSNGVRLIHFQWVEEVKADDLSVAEKLLKAQGRTYAQHMLAPEWLDGAEITEASDLYALGASLLAAVNPAGESWRDAPPELRASISSALHIDPNARGDLSQFYDALQNSTLSFQYKGTQDETPRRILLHEIVQLIREDENAWHLLSDPKHIEGEQSKETISSIDSESSQTVEYKPWGAFPEVITSIEQAKRSQTSVDRDINVQRYADLLQREMNLQKKEEEIKARELDSSQREAVIDQAIKTLERQAEHLKYGQERLKTEKQRLESERERLESEKQRLESERERLESEDEELKINTERFKADQERFKADQERFKADQERFEADQERFKVDRERFEADQKWLLTDQEGFQFAQDQVNIDQEQLRRDQEQLKLDQEQLKLDQELLRIDREQLKENFQKSIKDKESDEHLINQLRDQFEEERLKLEEMRRNTEQLKIELEQESTYLAQQKEELEKSLQWVHTERDLIQKEREKLIAEAQNQQDLFENTRSILNRETKDLNKEKQKLKIKSLALEEKQSKLEEEQYRVYEDQKKLDATKEETRLLERRLQRESRELQTQRAEIEKQNDATQRAQLTLSAERRTWTEEQRQIREAGRQESEGGLNRLQRLQYEINQSIQERDQGMALLDQRTQELTQEKDKLQKYDQKLKDRQAELDEDQQTLQQHLKQARALQVKTEEGQRELEASQKKIESQNAHKDRVLQQKEEELAEQAKQLGLQQEAHHRAMLEVQSLKENVEKEYNIAQESRTQADRARRDAEVEQAKMKRSIQDTQDKLRVDRREMNQIKESLLQRQAELKEFEKQLELERTHLDLERAEMKASKAEIEQVRTEVKTLVANTRVDAQAQAKARAEAEVHRDMTLVELQRITEEGKRQQEDHRLKRQELHKKYREIKLKLKEVAADQKKTKEIYQEAEQEHLEAQKKNQEAERVHEEVTQLKSEVEDLKINLERQQKALTGRSEQQSSYGEPEERGGGISIKDHDKKISIRGELPTKDSSPKDKVTAGQKSELSIGNVTWCLRYCPPGQASIGSAKGVGKPEERPQHIIQLTTGFWLSESPITQILWEEVMGTHQSKHRDPFKPVEGISWLKSVIFCNRLSEAFGLTPAYNISEGVRPLIYWDRRASGYRLPTEAEWEYTARSGGAENYRYAGSENLDEVGWFSKNAGNQAKIVKQKKQTLWGFFDLSGNVWEWCHDSWSKEAYRNRTLREGEHINPVHYRPQNTPRVIRGGSFYDFPTSCRLAARPGLDADGGYGVGLRPCLPILNES